MFSPAPMAVPLLARVGSLSTSCSLSDCDVISVKLAETDTMSLKITSPIEYPVGTALSRKSVAVCRILANLVTWQQRTDTNKTVYVN